MKSTITFVALLTACLTAAGSANAAAGDRQVTIVNATHRVMVEFYAQTPSSGDQDWFDRLGQDALKPGQSAVIDFGADGQCIYDFAGVFADGSKIYKYRVNVCAVSSYDFTDG